MEDDSLFSDVLRHANSKEPAHVVLNAVLQAVKSVIADQKLKPTPTAYFAALMTSLDATPSDEDNHHHDAMEEDDEDDDHTTDDERAKGSALTLLGIVMPKVPQAVIRAKIGDVSQLFLRIFNTYANSKSQSFFRSFIICITQLIESQRDPAVWALREITQLFQIVMSYIVSPRAKIRRAAVTSISSIMSSTPNAVIKNKFGTTIATFCAQIQNVHKEQNSQTVIRGNLDNSQTILHLLGSLKSIMPFLPLTAVTQISEMIFQLPTLTQPLVALLAMNCFESLLNVPESTTTAGSNHHNNNAGEDVLSSDFVTKLVQSLYQFQPHLNDVNMTLAFTNMLSQGFLRLARVNSSGCNQKLFKYFSTLSQNFASDKNELVKVTEKNFKRVILECISDTAISAAVTAANSNVKSREKTPLEKLIETLEGLLRYPYKRNWDHVLNVHAALFERLGAASYHLLQTLLVSLGELHGSGDQLEHQLLEPLLDAFGYAISAIGPEKFLSILPLGLESEDVTSRTWLLPLLQAHIKEAELKYFAKYFIPLAATLKQREAAALENHRPVESKNLNILYHQVWDLWPSFCDHPTDVAESFKFVAKTLGTVINDEMLLRKVVCNGLLSLIRDNKKSVDYQAPTNNMNGEHDDDDDNDNHMTITSSKHHSEPKKPSIPLERAKQNLAAISAFSKNFLPVLFNVFGTIQNVDERNILQRTIEAFISITDAKTFSPFFKNVVSKLLAAGTDNNNNNASGDSKSKKNKKESKEEEEIMEEDEDDDKHKERIHNMLYLTELAITFVPYIDLENVKFLFKVVKPQLSSKNNALQKKSFKVLESLCRCHPQFVKDRAEEIKKSLMDTLLSCNAAAKKGRLRCLSHVVGHLNNTQLNAVLGDVILCTKEVNIKTRESAYHVLVTIAKQFEEQGTGVKQLLMMVIAGLAGTTPHMTSAAICSLSRLLFEFHAYLDDAFLSELLKPIVILLSTNNREIIKSALGFVKVALISVRPELCEAHLPGLISNMSGMGSENKQHFKMKIRRILEKMIRKFGYDKILAMVPEADHKLMNHIRKVETRKERKQKQQKETQKNKKKSRFEALFEDDDSDDEDQEEGGEKEEEDSATPAHNKGKNNHQNNNKKNNNNKTFIMEDEAEPIDFSDLRSIQKVVSSKKQPQQQQKGGKKQGKGDKAGIDMDIESGKMVIEDEEYQRGRKKKTAAEKLESMDFAQLMEEQEQEMDNKIRNRKRRMEANDRDDYQDDDDEDKKNAVPAERKKLQAKRQRPQSNESRTQSNASQKKKGPGDAKKPGKVEPFAYLPLDPKLLNHRTSKKASGQFNNIVAAAKRGSQTKVQKKKRT